MYTIEEFPPQRQPEHSRAGERQARDPRTKPARGSVRLAPIAILTLATAGFAAAWWSMNLRFDELQIELAEARTSLDAAHSSLQLLWATTSRLDAAQGQRHDFLRDSIGSVQSFVDSAVTRLWQSAYLDHESRLDQNVRRLQAHDAALISLLDTARATGTRIDALFRENAAQFADQRTTNLTLTSLRQTLSALSGQVGDIESEVTLARTARAQTDLRVDGVERWASSFREAGLTGPVVQDRLAGLNEDLQNNGRRIDALKAVTDSLARVGEQTRIGNRPGIR